MWPQWPDSVPLSQRRAGNIRSWEIFIWMLFRYKLLAITFSKTPEILGCNNQPLWGHSLYHWKVTDIKKDLKRQCQVSPISQSVINYYHWVQIYLTHVSVSSLWLNSQFSTVTWNRTMNWSIVIDCNQKPPLGFRILQSVKRTTILSSQSAIIKKKPLPSPVPPLPFCQHLQSQWQQLFSQEIIESRTMKSVFSKSVYLLLRPVK